METDALRKDLRNYLQIAVAGAIEQAFTAPLEEKASGKPKTLTDEISEQVRLSLLNTVRGPFREAFQTAINKEVQSLVAEGFGLKLEDLLKVEKRAEPAKNAAEITARPEILEVKEDRARQTSAPKKMKKNLHLKQTEGLEELSSLAVRSPIAPKVTIPSHHAEPAGQIVTTPLSYDSKRKAWTEELAQEGPMSAPVRPAKSPLKIPQTLSLSLDVDSKVQKEPEAIQTTPVTYKRFGDEITPIEEEKFAHNPIPVLPGSVLPEDTNPDSKRAKFVKDRGISLTTGSFFAAEAHITATPLNAQGEEIHVEPREEDGDDEEDDDQRKESPPKVEGEGSSVKAPQQRKRKDSLRGLAFKNMRKSLANAVTPAMLQDMHASLPAECETPTSKTKKNLKDAKFGFASEEHKDNVPKHEDKRDTVPPRKISDERVQTYSEAPRGLRKQAMEKVKPGHMKIMALKEIYDDKSSGVEPTSAGVAEKPKKLEAGMECPSPTAKRGKLTRSATIGGLGFSKPATAVARTINPISTAGDAHSKLPEECRTPGSRDLASAKFEFPTVPKKVGSNTMSSGSSTSAPSLATMASESASGPIEPMD